MQKSLENARRAKTKEDWAEVEKYYNLVEQNDPTNIEAIFYSAYGKAMQTLVASDYYPREAAFKVLQNSISVLDDNFEIYRAREERDMIMQISKDILAISGRQYVYNVKGAGTIYYSNDKYRTKILFDQINAEFITTLNNIIAKFPEERKNESSIYYKLIIDHATGVIKPEAIEGYYKRWLMVDPKCRGQYEKWKNGEEKRKKKQKIKSILMIAGAALVSIAMITAFIIIMSYNFSSPYDYLT